MAEPTECVLREFNSYSEVLLKIASGESSGSSKGLYSAQSAYMITPILKISHFSGILNGSSGEVFIAMTSGAIYPGVPQRLNIGFVSLREAARPKSTITTSSGTIPIVFFSIIFAGLRSLWETPFSDMYFRPLSKPCIILTISGSCNPSLFFSIRSLRSPPSIRSKTG